MPGSRPAFEGAWRGSGIPPSAPQPGCVPSDLPRNSPWPPSGPLPQTSPPPGLWRGLCILCLSLGKALAGEEGLGSSWRPGFGQNIWRGIGTPCFQPRPVPPCTSALSTPAGSGAGGRGRPGTPPCTRPAPRSWVPSLTHCPPKVGSACYRRETALSVGGSYPHYTLCAPISKPGVQCGSRVGEGTSRPLSRHTRTLLPFPVPARPLPITVFMHCCSLLF